MIQLMIYRLNENGKNAKVTIAIMLTFAFEAGDVKEFLVSS